MARTPGSFRVGCSLSTSNASHQAASWITPYEDSFSLLTCQRLFSSTHAVFHKRCFSMEPALKPTLPLPLLGLNKRIALNGVWIICHCYHISHWPPASLQLHVKDWHFVVMNNSVIIFERAKKKSRMWKSCIQRNWFTWEYSELKLNKINHHVYINFSQSCIVILKSVGLFHKEMT